MKLKIIAKSDRGVFVGTNHEFGYVVISLDDIRDIDIADTLSSSTWDDRDGLFKIVQNHTKAEEIRICIENWHCTRELAFDFLRRLNSPTQIATLDGH